METWAICYTGAETVEGLQSFDACLDAIQRRFNSIVQSLDWRRPRRIPEEPSLVAWEFFDGTTGDVVAKLYRDYS